MNRTGALCAVHGCRSSKRRDTNLSFFSIPSDKEIRKTWIELIARPDLAEKEIKKNCHFVCSLHFDPSVIKYIPQLQSNALPSKLLPTTSNSSEEKKTKESSTQTNLTVINAIKNTDSLENTDLETTEALRSKAPRKRKHSSSTTVTSTTVENKTN